jgi:hypothetical protein
MGFKDIDIIQQHIRDAGEWLAQGEYADFTSYVASTIDAEDPWRPKLESPLEALFWIWWNAAARPGSFMGENFWIDPQQDVEVGGSRYRLDFVVKLVGWDLNQEVESGRYRWPLFGVELDGHSFHEKTREQVAYRNQRDRALQQAGWTVYHYSWKEMTERPAECVSEVLCAARNRYWQMLKEASEAKAQRVVTTE